MGFDFRKLPRCGVKVRGKNHSTCKQAAMPNGRCYLHGGKSTGPRTKEGLERMKASKLKHGYYTKENVSERKAFRQELQRLKDELERMF